MKFTDQMNRDVWLDSYPERIVSLVPSQTEFLFDLGLKNRMVGLTKFCVRPRGFKATKTIVGGTKNFHLDRIRALSPDLIIGNKEENDRMGINRLADDYPVWMSDVNDLEDAYQMMYSLGEITGKSEEAQKIIEEVSLKFARQFPSKGTAIYLIWQNPMMAAGSGTFINAMLDISGFKNLVEDNRYPEISLEQIRELNPDFLLLSTEPYPFKEEDVLQFGKTYSNSKVRLVDGEIFSWYGSRLRLAPDYFAELLP
ncbi:MAG TPA: helical backbone metal receptor [Cyclobacteriaceae bacterium]|nr:helical backbone metal receptor [Cyclobacteriaceae bacterium]